MTESYYYLVDFTAVCEECGQRFNGVIAKEVPVNDSALAGNILNSMADSVDAGIRKKAVESAVRDERWSDLDMCYGLLEHECPHCRARQSWDPMEKPQEPKQEVTFVDKALCIVLFAGIGLVAGVLAGFVVFIVPLMLFDFDSFIPALVVIAAAVIGGIVAGVKSNKEDEERTANTRDEVQKDYQRKLTAYNEYLKRLKDNPTRNKPQVMLSSGRFVSSMEAEFAKKGLDWRDF